SQAISILQRLDNEGESQPADIAQLLFAQALKPETALLAALALRSWCVNPTPQDIGRALCSVKDGCPTVCMGCLGKANIIHRLYNGERI
ncbi:hypothetical protein VQ044_20490, partial [Aurantimonas sp. C2-5-R2]|uniref:hypothetical protein n=1 Tax=Aurantimonas sp. C2-5-R2 TaxID=3113713 RepID=UPI002F92FFE4